MNKPDTNGLLSSKLEVTQNSCVVCAPLGATIAFAGVRKGMTLLHGSQGCATYIRRYTISHFREPLDAASSSFTEETAVFGGKGNLRLAFSNLVQEYRPEFVGVATTCLAETIGEDAASARAALADLSAEAGSPMVATVSTASYRGDHREGFHAALRAILEAATGGPATALSPASNPEASADPRIAVLPTLLSPADLRFLKSAFSGFGLDATLVSDYSETLDGGPWKNHRLLPEGGTPVQELLGLAGAAATIELGSPVGAPLSGGAFLSERFGVPRHQVPLPVGVRATDSFYALLSTLSGRPISAEILAQRSRLLDSYVDAHKVLFGQKVLLYGDRDLLDALSAFCREVGLMPVTARGEARDFAAVEEEAERLLAGGEKIALLLGSSKGYKTARKLGVPLVRIGFPVHDRFGGQRMRTLGYEGTQELFDRIVNALIERKQEDSDVGYTYY